MDEKQQALNQPLLPIYSPGHTIDMVCVGLIFIGMLLGAGFFSSSPGSLIVPFCTMLRSWFGVWAVIFAILMIVTGIALLIFRWMLPRIRMSRAKQILFAILFVLILLDGMTLSALYGGAEGGGAVGLAFVRVAVSGGSPSQSSFILWTMLIIALCLLAGGTIWIPQMFRALVQEIRDFSHQKTGEKQVKTEEDDIADGFDWKAEYRSLEDAAAEEAAEEEEYHEPAKAPETPQPKKPSGSSIPSVIPNLFTRKKTTEMEKTKQKTPQKSAGNTERSRRLPPLNLLDTELGFYGQNADHQEFIAQIEEAMDEFGTPVKVIGCSVGPSVIQYQVVPGNIAKSGKISAKNIRVTQVAQTERDLAVRLGVSNLSIQAPVPGESYIGIDIPNPQAMKVRLRPLIESPEFQRKNTPLTVALGRDITGNPVVVCPSVMEMTFVGI